MIESLCANTMAKGTKTPSRKWIKIVNYCCITSAITTLEGSGIQGHENLKQNYVSNKWHDPNK